MSSDYELLIELADALDASERAGAEKDEPEGARYITWSDTAARLVSTELREIARHLEVGT